jgi:molybdate transport system substrate-binding protein
LTIYNEKKEENVMLKVLVMVFLFVLLTAGISLAESQRKITVSAAASLKDVFEEIGRLYEDRNKGANVIFNFASSGALRRQIEVGAPVDVFASASKKDMDIIDQKGMVIKDTRVDIATNNVVLIVPVESKAEIKSFEDLMSKNIKRIAIGNPKTVPAGRYAHEVLNYYKVAEVIKDRLIFAENVRQVLDYVARKEVDAGIVYLTDAMVRPKKVKIAATAGEASHSPVVYPIAVVKGTRNESLAKEFISLVTSSEGKMILEKYGFKAVR